MTLQLPVINLDPDTDPWERQPDETRKRHSQFCAYRDLGRGRTLRRVADALALNDRYVRAVAAGYRWPERAEAHDRHRDEMHERVWLEERRRAAEQDSRILSAAIGKLAARIRTLRPDELTPATLIRLLDVVLRHRRALFGDLAVTVAVTGPTGDPLTVQLAELATMTPDNRRAVITDLAASVLRRTVAIAGRLDDDE